MENYIWVVIMKRSKLERNIEISAWILASLMLLKFVPKNRIREASLAFLFLQLITWIFGLAVVEKNLIKYPSRLFFSKSDKGSFTFEYFVYPAICAVFNLHYPEKSNFFIKFFHFFFYTSVITICEIFAVKYTNLIKYKNWNAYYSYITLWTTFYFSRIFYRWFFKLNSND